MFVLVYSNGVNSTLFNIFRFTACLIEHDQEDGIYMHQSMIAVMKLKLLIYRFNNHIFIYIIVKQQQQQ